ncbi:MAG TPA: GGDEF domain-containing protein [Solirubrobacteraceae bacterium]|nr:GGDEF domain-containing protein [Solirubrobacteraceae bacterium]
MAITERMRRRGDRAGSFAIALIDLDGLKEINETHGHDAGDDALAATAVALRAALRDGDLVARLGGDEFAIIVPDASLEATLALTERILAALPKPLTASAGVAVWDGRESAVELQRRADKAIYAAKRGGKGHSSARRRRPARGRPKPALSGWDGAFLTYTRPLSLDSHAQHWGMV